LEVKMDENERVAEEIAEVLFLEIPKCEKCGKPLKKIIEAVSGVYYTWELRKDGKYHMVNSEHYGEAYAYCGNCWCYIPTDAWDFWLERIAQEDNQTQTESKSKEKFQLELCNFLSRIKKLFPEKKREIEEWESLFHELFDEFWEAISGDDESEEERDGGC